MQIIAELHEVFNVVYVGKEELEQIEEVGLGLRQWGRRQNFEQVSEVVPGMEGNPPDVFIQHNPTDGKQFPKSSYVNTSRLVLGKVDTALLQQFDGVTSKHVVTDTKLAEIKLPDTKLIVDARKVSLRIRKRETQLNKL